VKAKEILLAATALAVLSWTGPPVAAQQTYEAIGSSWDSTRIWTRRWRSPCARRSISSPSATRIWRGRRPIRVAL